MAKARTNAEAAAFVFRCVECGHPATFHAETRQVIVGHEVVKGMLRETQTWQDMYLCTAHAEAAPFTVDPPRAITPLPHHAAAGTAMAAAKRRAARKAFREAQQPLGENWGKP